MIKIFPFKIIERHNVFDDHLLDIFGNSFKFDHEKGLAEWLKNSVDAYLRAGTPDSEQFLIFNFSDGQKNDAVLGCIDFVGMTENDIEEAFIRWGDPEAAKRNQKRRVYGGHGNGGKFYMRQMFNHSYFITYRDGHLNVFGFNKNRKYGFADGYKNEKMKPETALKFAGLEKTILPDNIKEKILTGKTGFTLVKGIGPAGMKNKIKITKIAERLKNHPQTRRLLLHKHISIIHNGEYVYNLLRPNEIKPYTGFEGPFVSDIPRELIVEIGGEKTVVELANKKFRAGKLILRTSEEALQGGRYDDLNRIDFIEELEESDKTVIASYELFELGVLKSPQVAFIYGECICPILEDPENYCVENDRTKLVKNDLTRALLKWIQERIGELANAIEVKEEKEQKDTKRKMSSAYNDYLNQWKNRWMRKIIGDMFAKGSGEEEGQGGRVLGKLQAPNSDLEFRFSEADIQLNESSPLTLKALVPRPIPIGSIISISSNNPLVEIEDKRMTIKSDYVKLTQDGKEVAVMNINVIGRREGETAKIIAKIGKFIAEISVDVVKKLSGGKTKKSKYPTVLLSGYDPDPLGQGGTITLSARHNVVHQRNEDVKEGIYWINTQSPLAVSILDKDKYGVNSPRWRDYLFQRYVEIFMKEALYELQKKDPDSFNPERIDLDIFGELIRRVHLAAAEDLEQFLFDDEYITESTKAGDIQ